MLALCTSATTTENAGKNIAIIDSATDGLSDCIMFTRPANVQA